MEIQTKAYGYDLGVACRLEAGEVIYREETGCAQGTVITVRDLFFNTPARKKFLRKDYTEAGYIEESVRKLSLAHPEISFRYINERKEKIFTPGDARLENAALCLYGKEVARELRRFITIMKVCVWKGWSVIFLYIKRTEACRHFLSTIAAL